MTHNPKRFIAFWLTGVIAVVLLVGLAIQATPTASAKPPPPLDDADASDQLIRGALGEVALKENEQHDLAFVADGPGILTLAWSEPEAEYKLALLDTDDKPVQWKSHAKKRVHDGQTLRYFALPLIEAGTYKVRLTVKATSSLKIGTAWMPFAQIKDQEEAHDDDIRAPQNRATTNTLTPRNDWLDGMPDLPVGFVGEGNNGSGRPRSYVYKARGRGLLTVAVRGKGDVDMAIQINDNRGQNISNGLSDIDFAGDKGAEQLAVDVSRAGNVEVVIVPHAGGSYWYSGSWLALEAPAKNDP